MRLLDRILVGFVYVFVYSLKAIFAVPSLLVRLFGGTDTSAQDAMTRRDIIETKARRRWIHDVEEAQRRNTETSSQ